MNVKEFENEYLYEKGSKRISYFNEESNSSIVERESNEKTINTQSNFNVKSENNESLLKKNLKGFNTIKNNNLNEVEEIKESLSTEESNIIDLEEKNSKEYYIDIDEKDLGKCKKHKNEFISYCIDCGLDLCIDCLNMESDVYSNTTKINKKHENHTKIKLEDIKVKFDEIKKLKEKTMKNEKIFKIYSTYLTTIFKIVKCFMNNFDKFKCFNLFKSIENAKKFLYKINDEKTNLECLQEEYKNDLKIISEKELISNIYFSSKIHSIHIKYADYINMSIFAGRNFDKLEELILVGNNIKDISSFSPNAFPRLKVLDLAKNNLDSNIIPIFKKLNLPELTLLNLYKNSITDIKIFELIKDYKKLNAFFIGENRFKFEESEEFYEFPLTLEEFGLTGNCEGEKINFVRKLGVDNLKILYLSRNKIDNLNCLKDIKFKRLREFWAISNNITDINEIMNINNKEDLWKINLKQNKIKNFNELINIIGFFPKLEILKITDNDGIGENVALQMKRKIKELLNKDINIELYE